MKTKICLFETVNPLAKIYYSSILQIVVLRMENGLKEFKEKAPHRKDYIEATEKSISDLQELLEWIEILYSDAEMERRRNFDQQKLNLLLLKDRNVFEAEAEKLLKTLNFNLQE